MSRLRICLVSREIAPFWGAGIGTYAAQMLRAWADSGHEAHLLTADHESLRNIPDPIPGVRVHTLRDSGGAAIPSTAPRPRFAFQRHALAVYHALLALHEQHPFDAIEFPEYWAEGCYAIAAKRTLAHFQSCALIVHLHTPTRLARSLNAEHWLDEELATLQCEEERAIADADAVISPTQSLLATVHSPPAQLKAVIPYPFKMVSSTATASAPAETQTILYFGRLERRKGVELLIQAASTLLDEGRSIRIRLIGADTRTGPRNSSMREHLAALIPQAHAARFSLEDPIPREALAEIIRETIASRGLCCFPSLWENFPNVCLEAMSQGALVVGSDAGGMSEIIEHGRSGLLFRAGDAADLASKLREAIANDQAREQMPHAAPERIRDLCNPETIVRETAEVITQTRRGAIAPAARASRAPNIALIITDPLAPQHEDLTAQLRACAADWALIIEPGAYLDLIDGPNPTLPALQRAIAQDPSATAFALASTDGTTLHTPTLHPELLAALQPALPALLIRTSAVNNLPQLSDLPRPAQLWALALSLTARGQTIRTIPLPLVRARFTPIPGHTRESTLAHLSILAREAHIDHTIPLRLLLAHSAYQREQTAQERKALTAELISARHTIADQQSRLAALEDQLASSRYRLADKLNEAAKSTGIHSTLKSVAARLKPEDKP